MFCYLQSDLQKIASLKISLLGKFQIDSFGIELTNNIIASFLKVHMNIRFSKIGFRDCVCGLVSSMPFSANSVTFLSEVRGLESFS